MAPTFYPFEVNVPHLAYAFLGGFVVLFGLFSLVIKERLYIGEAVIATVVGIAIGPYALNFFSPGQWGGIENIEITNEITLEVTRVVIAIGVFAVGVELPKAYMKKHWRSLAFLLGPAMVWGWLISALLMWLILGRHLDYLSCLAIAACVTPTDPILAASVVNGKFADKHVPAHIRHILSAESGSNDGAAFPFLYIALYFIIDGVDGYAVGEWFYITWLYEVALGIVIGSILGFSARKTMKFCERKGLIDRQSFVAQYVSLAILSIGITTLLGSDDLLAAFACGTAFAWDGFFNKATEDSMFSNVIDLLFNCAAFIYIGAIIPFSDFSNPTLHLTVWQLVLLALAILAFRRLPVIMALYRWIPDIKTSREAAFVGWFGPMGVGAIFISTLASTHLPIVEGEPTNQAELLAKTIGPVVAFLVLTSVLCHGLSIPFFSLTRRVHSITHTWSRQSMDRRDEPAWTSHTRRITPGDIIRVNRDDDNDGEEEVADDGTTDRGGPRVEKDFDRTASAHPSQDSDATAAEASAEAPFEGGGGERKDIEAMEHGTYSPEAEQQEQQERRRDSQDDDDGRRTPILAEYREGDHLVRERKGGEGEEVTVEVIKDYYHKDREAETSTFRHPRPLRHDELNQIHGKIDSSAEEAAAEVRDGGSDAVDKLGLGMMGPEAHAEEKREEAEVLRDAAKRQRNMAQGDEPESAREADAQADHAEARAHKHLADGGAEQRDEEEMAEEADEEAENSGTSSGPLASIRKAIHSTGKGRRMSIRQSLFGKRERSTADTAEEGRGESQHEMTQRDSPPASIRRVVSIDQQRDRQDDHSLRMYRTTSIQYDRGRESEASSIRLPPPTRSGSPTQGRTIRFAPEAQQDSRPAPGQQYYKRPGTGNPELSLFRAPSVQSTHSLRDGEY